MKKTVIAILVLLLTITVPAQTKSIIIGSDGELAAGNRGPLNRTGNSNANSGGQIYSRHFAVYPAAALCGLAKGAKITKIGWYKSAAGSAPGVVHTFKVYMKNTNASGSAGGSWDGLIGDAVQVYDNAAMTIPQGEGWWELDLQTPFTYTGESVEVYTDWYSGGGPFSDNSRTTGRIQFQFSRANNFLCGGVSSRNQLSDGVFIGDETFMDLLNIKITYSGGTPKAEICGNRVDDNCNGQVDEGCEVDKDGDGFKESDGDCNDNDEKIFPGAVEVCGDGIDNNCNGEEDEGFDKDKDGYKTCDGDCNDGNPNINPGEKEIVGNEIDENCDGKVGKAELYGLEVVQVIQSWNDDIPLIEHKRTIVRAHIKSKEGEQFRLKAKLTASRNGIVLGSIPARNANSFYAPYTNDEQAYETSLRGKLSNSLNFLLPPKWTEKGDLTLKLEGCDCKEAADVPNDCAVTITFHESQTLNFKLFKCEWSDQSGNKYSISDKAIRRIRERIERTVSAGYPTAKVNIKLGGTRNLGKIAFPSNDPRGAYIDVLFTSNDNLSELYNRTKISDPNTYYLGVIDGPILGGPAGWSGIEERIFENGKITAYRSVASIKLKEPDIALHEIGHMFGREHTPFCKTPIDIKQDYPVKNKYIDPKDGTEKLAIGPMNTGVSVNDLVYGFENMTNSILAPTNYFDLMNYCSPSWMGDFTYKALFENIKKRYSSKSNLVVQSNKSAIAITPVSKPYQVFRGTINNSKSQIAFKPVALLHTAAVLPLIAWGDYELRLLDEQGATVTSISFDLQYNFKESSEDPTIGSFWIPVPQNPLVKKAIVLKNNIAIGEINASNTTPSVKLLSPNGGETYKGASALFTWEADDADGDLLSYALELSKDGGITWELIDIDIKESVYIAELNYIGGAQNARLRVLVSDGFNVAMDESDNVFTTPNTEPYGYISMPFDGEVYIGEEPIHLEGTFSDIEDGNLTGTSLTWSSSLNGFLGNGETFHKLAEDLKAGEHTITLTATDKDGASVSMSVKVKVVRNTSAFSLICPSDIIADNTDEGNELEISFAARAIGGASVPTIVYKIGPKIITSPYSFPIGTTDVTVTASNGVDPDLTCVFKVTVGGTSKTWYLDSDEDGYGSPENTTNAPTQPQSYVANNQDCKDDDNSINPGKDEVCNDGKDNDCDGRIDEDCTTGTTTWYRDADGDGFGNGASSKVSDKQPRGYVSNALDCNDKNKTKGGPEVCDGRDNDCDGKIDNGLALKPFYSDFDGDGYGTPKRMVMACAAPPRFVDNSEDCNDDNKNVYPGAPELCDGRDNDCDGTIDEGFEKVTFYHDFDKDGYGRTEVTLQACAAPLNYAAVAGDCNDRDATIHPGAKGSCNGKDDDCDGKADEGCRTTTARQQKGLAEAEAEQASLLQLSATPNPARHAFTLRLQSASSTPVSLRIVDALGRVVESRQGLTPNTTLTIGEDYRPGTYHAQALQKGRSVTVKLVKTAH